MKIGFEFEFLHQLYDDEILDDLGSKYNIVVDTSIRHDEKSLKRDGWHRWEIITPPETPKKAFETLRTVQSYLIDTNARTNTSCGFHVNISERDMSKFDPMTLIAVTDENLISNTFNRQNNDYCPNWAIYFDILWDRINKSEKFDKKRILIDNATMLVKASAYGEWIDARYKYAQKVSELVISKYTSINVSKLELDYVEFRMIGGTDYHHKMLDPFVMNLADGMRVAAQGVDRKIIREYFNQYGV